MLSVFGYRNLDRAQQGSLSSTSQCPEPQLGRVLNWEHCRMLVHSHVWHLRLNDGNTRELIRVMCGFSTCLLAS